MEAEMRRNIEDSKRFRVGMMNNIAVSVMSDWA